MLGYIRGYFFVLVVMEIDNFNEFGVGVNVDSIESVYVIYLLLVDYEGKLLFVYFLLVEEVRVK